jgi:Luciferase-like monooxygenase
MTDFGLFHTWNAMYAGGQVPWDPAYRGGKLLEEDAYARNFVEVDAVEAMGWDYIWLGGGHSSKQASMDPQVLLLAAVIAGRTSRIKIGSSVHRPVLKQPWETASARALPMNARRLIICSWRIPYRSRNRLPLSTRSAKVGSCTAQEGARAALTHVGSTSLSSWRS